MTLQALLTLFAECFSPFHHCTCALSALQTYSALAETHLPVFELQSQGALLVEASHHRPPACQSRDERGCHPVSLMDSHPNLTQPAAVAHGGSALHPATPASSNECAVQTGWPAGWVNQHAVVSLHSPLLGQSPLSSSPPPTDMLKLGGSSRRKRR